MWSKTKYNLILDLKIDFDKYENQVYKLPPKELGNCKKWIFMNGDKETRFIASWELQRIKSLKLNFEQINENFKDFVIQ
tara:strand:+ start:1555 stop:1791 length:237 start_codon:yes stop_codon:yes gene_type:complete